MDALRKMLQSVFPPESAEIRSKFGVSRITAGALVRFVHVAPPKIRTKRCRRAECDKEKSDMKTKQALLLLLVISALKSASTGMGQEPPTDLADVDQVAQVKAVLQAQGDAWNRGDLVGFMAHYWKSDQLTFSSGGQTTRGWQNTLDRYQRRYATAEKMGRLSFSELQVFAISPDACYVLGHWQLDRGEPTGGNFSLVMQRLAGRWLIVHDHTSVLPADEHESLDG